MDSLKEVRVKVIGINGSPKAKGNTYQLIEIVFEQLKKEGIETEIIHIADKALSGCRACMKCWETKNEKCIISNDKINECVQKAKKADAIILGSPTYFANVSSEMKAFIDRVGMVTRANDNLLKRKLGAAVVAVRRSGEIHTFNSMNHLFLISEMIVVGSSYWNNGHGRNPGEVKSDEEGITTMENLGKNISWLLKKVND